MATHNVYAGRTGRFIGEMTLNEVYERFEDFAIKTTSYGIYILELH